LNFVVQIVVKKGIELMDFMILIQCTVVFYPT